jgi:hypothetical protein
MSSRISFVLKTNFPFTATRFPFFCSLRTRYSSLASVRSFRKRVFSEVVLSRADPDRSIYRFTGVSRVKDRTIELTSDVASRCSVPSGGELSIRERSRAFGVVIGDGVIRGVGVGIRRVTALRPFTTGSDAAKKLELVEAVPFPLDFKDLAMRFHLVSFPGLFRDTSNLEPTRGLSAPDRATYAAAASSSLGVGSRAGSETRTIKYNRAGQRLDELSLPWDQNLVKRLERQDLCLRYFLSRCADSPCDKSRQGELNENKIRALKRVARLTVCRNGSSCEHSNCVVGHSCAYDGYCGFGLKCKFGPEMHGVNKVPHVTR